MIQTYRMKSTDELMFQLATGGWIQGDYTRLRDAVDFIEEGKSITGEEIRYKGIPLHLYEMEVIKRDEWLDSMLAEFDAEKVPCRHNFYTISDVKISDNEYSKVCSNCGETLRIYDEREKDRGTRKIRFRRKGWIEGT